MKILIPSDDDFDYRKCESLYNQNIELMNNYCSFEDIIRNSHFYAFYKGKELISCAYVTDEGGKLFLSGFSKRKNHLFNVNVIKKILSFYNCEIYAKTKNKTAEFFLRKCGFIFIKKDKSQVKYYKKEK